MHLSIGIVGASGYTGVELFRLLHVHSQVSIIHLFGNRSAGKHLSDIYPGSFSGKFEDLIHSIDELPNFHCDVLFLAVSHGSATQLVEKLSEFKGLIIDLSTDFRWQPGFVYGLVEWFTADIKKTNRISNPGCFASAIQMALLPLLTNGINALFHITALTGSSGSGTGLKPGLQFTERFGNIKAYKVLHHQHEKEIKETVKQLTKTNLSLQFTPVSAPLTRGIWAVISFRALQANLFSFFEEAYYNKPFVRLYQDVLPELKPVIGSNFVDIGVVQQGAQTVVGVALDNLVKGASGQAIQNMNLALGFNETEGLLFPGLLH